MQFSKRVFKVFQSDMHWAQWRCPPCGHTSVALHLERNRDQSMFAGWLFNAQQVLKTPRSLHVSFSTGVVWGVGSGR